MPLIEIVPTTAPRKATEAEFAAMSAAERLRYCRQWDQRQFQPKPEPRIISSRRR